MYRLFLIGCLVLALRPEVQAEVIDRLAITVRQQAITELQLDEELRVTAFINHQPVVRDIAARRAAANRLIEQSLVAREMELSHYPLPPAQDVNVYFEQIQNGFDSPAAFEQALGDYDLTESTLRDHLALQLTTLRFIEYRFRPDLATSDTALIEQRTDEALDRWLKETRKQANIVYLDKSLQ